MANPNPTPAYQALLKELDCMIEHLQQEGVVDDNFKSTHDLKEFTGPLFFEDLINNFIKDSHTTINEMTLLLGRRRMNYKQLEQLCIKLKGGASCLGACRVAKACAELRKAADSKSYERCVMSLNTLENKFSTLEDRLEVILQLERKIIAAEDP